jgi:hypothetical protein
MMEFGGTKDDRARERRSRAIEASSAVARSLGIDCSRPTIPKDSNNTIVHLALLQTELSIGLHLASRNAPIECS